MKSILQGDIDSVNLTYLREWPESGTQGT